VPVKFRVHLIAQEEIKTSELTPDRLHGLFFSLLGRNLAEILHKDYSVKPFSIWNREIFRTEGKFLKISLEIAFLSDELFPQFLSSYILSQKKHIEINGHPLLKSKKPYIRKNWILTYQSLLADASPEKTIVFDFKTPVSFKKYKIDYPLPDPFLVFKSLFTKWNRYSDLKAPDDVMQVIKSRIAVSGAWLKTKKVEFAKLGKIVGFTGRVVYWVDVNDTETLKWVNALARFAEFAGVGRKTTMGFGKVRLVV